MGRGRMLSKSLSTSMKRMRLYSALGPLAEFADVLFMLLVAHADDFGRVAGDAETVKLQINPISTRTIDDFETALHALADVRLIERYIVSSDTVDDGVCVVQVVKFEQHQIGLYRRTRPKLPDQHGSYDPPTTDRVQRHAVKFTADAVKSTTSSRQSTAASPQMSSEQEQEQEQEQELRTGGACTEPDQQVGTTTEEERVSPVQPVSTNEEGSAPLDEWLRQLQSDYPVDNVSYGYRTQTAFVDQFRRDARPAHEVWREMRANLENQKRGYRWRYKGMVPKLENWLRDGLWRQQHKATGPDALSDSTRVTLAAMDAILREEEEGS